METIESINEWADQTFGPYDDIWTLYFRAKEEMEEFDEVVSKKGMMNEAADVIITLYRLPGIQKAIDSKMKVNRNRRWVKHGDGTGHHIKET